MAQAAEQGADHGLIAEEVQPVIAIKVLREELTRR
jgi:hypothetical protein